MEQNSEIIIYTAPDGTTKLQVQLEDETVWLTQDQMAMLFGKAKSTINEHIKNIYAEEELEENQTLKKFGISEFQQKAPNYYNLDVIISDSLRPPPIPILSSILRKILDKMLCSLYAPYKVGMQ